MNKYFNVDDYKKLVFRNLYLTLIALAISIYIGPIALSKYNGEIFVYERLISNFAETCTILTIFTSMWIFKSIYKDSEKNLKRRVLITKIAAIFSLVIVPLVVVYGWVLFEALIHFEIGSLSLIVIQLLASIVILMAVVLIIMYIYLKMASIWEAIIYSMLIMMLPYLFFGTLDLFLLVFVSGYPIMFTNELLGLISPMAALSYLNNSGIHKYGIELFISYWFIFDLVVLHFIDKILDKRANKKTKMDYANSGISQFITVGITSSVLILLSLYELIKITKGGHSFSVKSTIIPILGTLTTFVILASLQNRKMMKFKDNFVNLGVICIITGILFSIIYFTKGFGFSDSIPSNDDILHVTAITVLPREYDPVSTWDIYPYVKIKKPESIDKIVKFHEEVIKDQALNQELIPEEDVEPFVLFLTYYLKNGDSVARTYSLNENLYESFKTIQYDPDILEQSEPLFQNNIKKISIYNDIYTEGVDVDKYLPEIQEAYRQDLVNITYENSKSENNVIKYHIQYSMDTIRYIDEYGEYQEKKNDYDTFYQIILDERFENTLRLIESLEEPYHSVDFNYVLIDENIDSTGILLDSRVKRIQDIHFKLEDIVSYETQKDGIEAYHGKLLNIYDKSRKGNKLLIEGNDNTIKIKTLLPIGD